MARATLKKTDTPNTAARPDEIQRAHGLRTAHDGVVQGLGRSIVGGTLRPGSMLPSKPALCAQYCVSHTTLREALQTLAAKGLIGAKTKIGTWTLEARHWNMFDPDVLAWRLAKGADPSFVASLFEVRQSLEPAAAALAARRRNDADIADLRGSIAMMSESLGDKRRFTQADVRFHSRILEASTNPIMRSIGAVIATALAAAFELTAPTDDQMMLEGAISQHSDIVDAIERCAAQEAANSMMKVIQQGWIGYTDTRPRLLAYVMTESFLQEDEVTSR